MSKMVKVFKGDVIFDNAPGASRQGVTARGEVDKELPDIPTDAATKNYVLKPGATGVAWVKVVKELPDIPTDVATKNYVLKPGETGVAWTEVMELPALPEEVADKVYALKLVNGVLTWVEETVS